MSLKLESDTKQVTKPILCDTYTVIHINHSSLIAFINNKGNYVKSDNMMTICLTFMTSNINDTRVVGKCENINICQVIVNNR